MSTTQETLTAKIRILNSAIWEGKASGGVVKTWLRNFVGADEDKERLHALYLLSQFMYFGDREFRELLRALYREVFRYPIVEAIRRQNADTLDSALIEREFAAELNQTRFVPMGHPSESGGHLAYPFRQENGLAVNLFLQPTELFTKQNKAPALRLPNVKRYVFIDDFCGSGLQARRYGKRCTPLLKRLAPTCLTQYCAVIATAEGLGRVRAERHFDEVHALVLLDQSFKCFETGSRVFVGADAEIEQQFAYEMCLRYGKALCKEALGFGDGQLLLAFHHNTPNNTLPVFWSDSRWVPVFKRFNKVWSTGGQP